MSVQAGIYAGIAAYIGQSVAALAGVVEENDLNIEIPQSQAGEDWKGIRIAKTVSTPPRRVDIAGIRRRGEMRFELVSKQDVKREKGAYIAYSAYLEGLAGHLRQRFKEKDRPALPAGCKLTDIQETSNSVLKYTDGSISEYAINIKFIYETGV